MCVVSLSRAHASPIIAAAAVHLVIPAVTQLSTAVADDSAPNGVGVTCYGHRGTRHSRFLTMFQFISEPLKTSDS